MRFINYPDSTFYPRSPKGHFKGEIKSNFKILLDKNINTREVLDKSKLIRSEEQELTILDMTGYTVAREFRLYIWTSIC